jgi:hypothetical protein
MKCLLLGAVLGLVSSAAAAFQETKGGAQEAPAASPKVQLDTSGTGTSIDTSGGGMEVRIPGLGKLGVLPKLDFGLELLYGANNQGQSAQDKLRDGSTDEGAQIRGSVKHRF